MSMVEQYSNPRLSTIHVSTWASPRINMEWDDKSVRMHVEPILNHLLIELKKKFEFQSPNNAYKYFRLHLVDV